MFGFFNNKSSLASSGLLEGFVDNHSHILFGVDDGVKTLEDSLKILEFLQQAGAKTVWCTPHIMEDVPNKTSDLKARFALLQEAWKGSVELRLASENMIDNLFLQRLKERDFLTHGDGKLLMETSTWAPPMNLWNTIDSVLVAGYTPIIAHPERYQYMSETDYRRLKEMGCELQLNLPSILGVYGEEVSKKAERILENGWYSITGTDCHRFRALEGQYTCKILSKNTVSLLKKIICR